MITYKKIKLGSRNRKTRYIYTKTLLNGTRVFIDGDEFERNSKKEREALLLSKPMGERKVQFAEDCKKCGKECECVGHRPEKMYKNWKMKRKFVRPIGFWE